MKKYLYILMSAMLIVMSACDEGMENINSKSETPDSLMSDSMRIAYSMLYGQWQEFYKTLHDYDLKGENLTDSSILTLNQNFTVTNSSKPNLILGYKIREIYKLKSDTLECEVDYFGPKYFDSYIYYLRGNTLIIHLNASSCVGLPYSHYKRIKTIDELTVSNQ